MLADEFATCSDVASIVDEFEWRGMLYDVTDGAREMFARERVTAYVGFDPTASSLHVGSLLPIMALARLQRAGHSPIALVGGGTGLIGDPSGKSQERTLLSIEEVERNVAGMRAQLERFLDFDAAPNPARLVNNADWLRLDHAAGVPARHRQALHRELHARQGIGEAAAGRRRRDFVHRVQLSAAAGARLPGPARALRLHAADGRQRTSGATSRPAAISSARWRGGKAHGLVLPLVTTSAGTKFGKTEAGTVWLDPARTSPFRFYQFWLNTDDRDVVKYLKFFTWLDRAGDRRVSSARSSEAPEAREAQRRLAREVTAMVHGAAELQRAERASAGALRRVAARTRARRSADGVRGCAVDDDDSRERCSDPRWRRRAIRAAAGGVER